MELFFENIGIIKKGSIELNGMTVICGNNNTGKSTVGKILFCVFNSCYKMDDNIFAQITSKLLRDIEDIIRGSIRNELAHNGKLSFNFIMDEPFQCDMWEFVKFAPMLSDDHDVGLKQVDEFIVAHLESSFCELISDHNSLNYKVYKLIKDAFNIPIQPYKISRVKSFFYGVFNKQVLNAMSDSAFVSAVIKGKEISINFNSEDEVDISLNFDFTNRAIFIDSPDKYKDSLSDWNSRRVNLENNSLYDLVKGRLDNEYIDSSDVKRTIIEDRLVKVNNVINRAINGTFKRNDEKAGGFQFKGLDTPINLSNLSTGVKALLLFRTLCESGKLSERDVLILDEPEIHLHPEWQLVYAEALVLLQKELDLTILITTHSPYFLEAIDVFSKKYDRENVLNYYLAENASDGYGVIEEVTGEINKIYKKMYTPLKRLEEEV